MKKILFVINSLANGGAERALVNLVNNLPKDKYEITVFSLYSSGIYDESIKDTIKYKYLFKEQRKILKRILLPLICKILPKKLLHKCLFKEKYDYEIAFLQGFPTELVRNSFNCNSKKIAFIHSDFSTNYDVEKLYKDTENCLKCYKQFDKVAFVSQTAMQGFHQRIGLLENECVVHNVVESEMITKSAEESCEIQFRTNAISIISVGRLIPLKSFDRLIMSLKQILTENSKIDLECWIVGDGPSKNEIETLILNNGLEKYVKLLGYKKNPYKYMKSAQLYVCTSTTEGYNTAVVEALILGVPILTTDVSGMREIIGDTDCGLIVDNSIDGIVGGLKRILKDPIILTSMKNAAIKQGLEFHTQKQVKEFLNIIEK